MKEKLTVFLITYNRPNYLKKAIESVLAQSFKVFKFIIIDNGSTDNTQEIIKKFNDDRIEIISLKKNIGLEVFKMPFDICSSQYCNILHDDDIILPNLFQEQIMILEADLDINIIACKAYMIDGNDKIISQKDNNININKRYIFNQYEFLDNVEIGSIIVMPTVMYRMEFIKKYNMCFNEKFNFVLDAEFWYRCNLYKGKICVLNKRLMKYRVHDTQTTFKVNRNNDSLFYTIKLVEDLSAKVQSYREINKNEYIRSNEYLKKIIKKSILDLDLLTNKQTKDIFAYLVKNNYIEDIEILFRVLLYIYLIDYMEEDIFNRLILISINNYICIWNKLLTNFKVNIDKLKPYKKIAIFGKAYNGQMLKLYLNKIGITIETFIITLSSMQVNNLKAISLENILESEIDLIIISNESKENYIEINRNLSEFLKNQVEIIYWEELSSD